MNKILTLGLATVLLTTSAYAEMDGGRGGFRGEDRADDRGLMMRATSTATGTPIKIFMDINKDGYIGPFERQLTNRVLNDKALQADLLAKYNITPAELQKALATSTTLDQVLAVLQAKGIATTEAEKLAALNKLSAAASSTLEQAWKKGEIKREQKDRVKAEANEYLQELNRKLAQASSTLQASTSNSFMNRGFMERVNSFWAKFFRKTATSTATSTAK